jgi:ribosomal protein S18 acetylase RimI-like enzyme
VATVPIARQAPLSSVGQLTNIQAGTAHLPALRAMAEADVLIAGEMAARVLQQSVLAQLGSQFMVAFLRSALRHPATIALTATDHTGRHIGFALASTHVHEFNRYVKPRILVQLAIALLSAKRLALVPKFARTFSEEEPQPHISAELLLLFVEPDRHRRGTGRWLLRKLEEDLRERMSGQYRVAVRSQLHEAKSFYEAVGFQFEQELMVLGQPMTYFTRQL